MKLKILYPILLIIANAMTNDSCQFANPLIVNSRSINSLIPDTLLWSYDTLTKNIFFTTKAILFSDSQALIIFTRNKSLYKTESQRNATPSQSWVYFGTQCFSIDSILSLLDDFINNNQGKYSSCIATLNNLSPYELYLYLSEIITIQSLLVNGIDKLVYNNSNQFIEWNLNENYYKAKYILHRNKSIRDKYVDILNQCPQCVFNIKFIWPRVFQAYDVLDSIKDEIEKSITKDKRNLGETELLMNRLNDFSYIVMFPYVTIDLKLKSFKPKIAKDIINIIKKDISNSLSSLKNRRLQLDGIQMTRTIPIKKIENPNVA